MSQSNAELLLAVQLEQAGIPFEREVRFAPPRRWRADFRVRPADMLEVPSFLLGVWRFVLIEIDGGSWVAGRHTRGAGFAKDLEKLNAAAELGYRVLRYVPAQIESGEALAQIRRILSMKAAA